MSQQQSFSTDIVIVGAGPVGLFAVFEAGMMKMRCHVIDTLDFIGGQCSAMYPEKPIYDIPGYPEIAAQELVDNLEKQASPFKPEFHLGQSVESFVQKDDGLEITTSKGTVINAKAMIIAAGCGAFGPNRPPIENIQGYEGTSVFYMVQKKEAFRGKKVVIAGGGDSAVDWTLALHDVAEKVSVVHRRKKFRAAPESVDQLNRLADEGKIDFVVPYQLADLKGNNGQIEEVIVADLDGNSKAIEADILLPFFGLAMELGPIANWGLNLDEKHITVDPATMATNVERVYAIGDIVRYPGKLKLILNGFSEAAMAAHAIYPLVHPDQAYHFEYSTTQGVQAVG